MRPARRLHPLDRRALTAVHEAGHVVVSLALGRKVRSATISPEPDRLGAVRNSKLRRLDPAISDRRMRITIEREAMILLAGAAAEQLAGGTLHGGRTDRRDALSLVGFLSGSVEEERAYVSWLRERTRTLLRLHWSAVLAISRALLASETLDGPTVRDIARRADPALTER